jgi:CheY-like chemotaxis protein
VTIGERALAVGLAEQRGHPSVVLGESSIDLAALELIPRVIAEQHRVLPVAIDVDSITLAVPDVPAPGQPRPAIFDQIEFATGRSVYLLLAVEDVIAAAIKDAYAARAAGESTLVGTTRRPRGSPEHVPLSIVRPPSQGLIADLMSAPSAPPVASALVEQSAAQRPQILVIDDEEDIRALLKKVLTYDGYDVVEAPTGRHALDLLRTLRPAAILLDAMLPEIHGFDICATLKKSQTFATTPVVVISAVYKGWENARTVQETHGADAFVEKPFDVHYLRQLVARMVGKELPKNTLGADWQRKVKELRDEANIHYQLGDWDSCEETVKRWRALDPFDAHAWLVLGNAKTRRGDPEGAMKAYERAATFDGELFAAFKNLAVVYDQLGFVQRAQLAWYRAYELAPDGETRRRIEERLALRP